MFVVALFSCYIGAYDIVHSLRALIILFEKLSSWDFFSILGFDLIRMLINKETNVFENDDKGSIF